MIKISVVIPTYNRAHLLKRAIKSVLDQTGQNENYQLEEVLVIDDGSSDNTRHVIESISDHRIHYHRLDKNSGASHARNIGVGLSCGEWIAFQDSDDIWMQDKLDKQVRILNENRALRMIVHPIRAVFPGGREKITPVPGDQDQLGFLISQNFAGTPTMLVEKKIFMELKGFDEDMKALEDWDFALRYAIKNRMGIVPEALLQADMEVEGISANMSNYYDGRCRMIAKYKAVLLEKGYYEKAAESLLLHANENGVLSQVGKMLEYYLKTM